MEGRSVVRLSEDKIKEAILHPEIGLRIRAIHYFAGSYSPDPAIMPLVIEAVERYGRSDASQQVGGAVGLVQSAATIDWLLHELQSEEYRSDENYPYNLGRVLEQADPALLLPHRSVLLDSALLHVDQRQAIDERLEMLAWDEATCWERLQGHCERVKDASSISAAELPHAERIVEALARYGNIREQQVLAILDEPIDDCEHSPLTWLQPLVARLAGLTRLESAIPRLLGRLLCEDQDDLMLEECTHALHRIGTPAVIEAAAAAYPTAPPICRFALLELLEHIHSDLAVEKCMSLLGQETSNDFRIHIASALLHQFAEEGIDEARKLVQGEDLGFDRHGLRITLLETCTIMERKFPEYDEWLAEEQRDKEEHRRLVEELKDEPTALLIYGLQRLMGKKEAAAAVARMSKTMNAAPATRPQPVKSPLAPEPVRASLAIGDRQPKVGRNDPCPCGSGKKFKKCCLRSP
jgi:hypothetical protein